MSDHYAILFDLDGTLIDSTEAILESFEVAYSRFDRRAPDAEHIKALIGYPLDIMFSRLGVSGDENAQYVSAYKTHYRVISRQKTVLLPGAREAVSMAAPLAKLGIVTTKTGRYSRELLEHMDLMHYFQTLVGREDVLYPKPHPEPVERAIFQLGCLPEKCWMVGDTLLDIEAGERAGTQVVATSGGYEKEGVLRGRCRHVEPGVLEAVTLIGKLMNHGKA